MKYLVFLICVASLIVGISFVIKYNMGFSKNGLCCYYDYEILIFSAIGFGLFLFTSFYLWKNNFFKRED